ncbi:NAD(P)H-dependent oxidoreductase [Micromonospora sp. C31]|uniref:NADPH-dependent FMN reductase n=1 Tax=Micromonospora sp. C31 TaxID=2824876 RepID=UPI001B377435|nr:NAD(P)H-dependent oxidoreductase [Micromonospora sp. C31]MBQ1074038.1 NAD(P)H-dependent oxidoreductase [Micromonospora sp. C31]
MTTQQLRLAVLVASTREGRFGPVVATWFVEQARRHGGFDTDVIDLAEVDLPATLTAFGAPQPAAVDALAPRLAAADAFVVVTPEYNHSYPASIKTAIDWYRDEWYAKPVGFVSYGGLAGGLRAVEHLRPVFAEMHATTVRDTVSFHGCWDKFDESGTPVEPQGCNNAAKTVLDQLGWWGRALREARERVPYAA